MRSSSPRLLTLALPLLAALLLLACDYATTQAAEQVEGEALAFSVGDDLNPAQRRGIEALKAAWDAAWGDAEAFAATYTDDAEFINPLGAILPGREAIQATHAFLFDGPFAGSTQTSEIRRAVSLTGTVVMVDLDVALTGYQFLPPGLPETEPGVVRTRVKWIAVREGRDWRILAQHMTAIPPAP